ncbi:universal stress protein [Streptomyces sp. NPDC002537]
MELHVVAGADGSAAGLVAVDRAAGTAVRLGASLRVLHVCHGSRNDRPGPARVIVELTGGRADEDLAFFAFAQAALRGCEVEAFFPWFDVKTWPSGVPGAGVGPVAADDLCRVHRIDSALRRAMQAHPEVPLLAHPVDRTGWRRPGARALRCPARRPARRSARWS